MSTAHSSAYRTFRRVLRWSLVGALAGAAVGAFIETLNDLLPNGLAFASAMDVWPPATAIVGFAAGAACSVVYLLARRSR